MSLLSRLFKKPGPEPEPSPEEFTFKQRVEAFWVWYSSVADRFYQTIEEKRCSDLSGELSGKVDELLPGMAWVFGADESGKATH